MSSDSEHTDLPGTAPARWLATVVPVVVLLTLATVAWIVLGHSDDLDGVIDAFVAGVAAR